LQHQVEAQRPDHAGTANKGTGAIDGACMAADMPKPGRPRFRLSPTDPLKHAASLLNYLLIDSKKQTSLSIVLDGTLQVPFV
jgi:hypothetical protein